MQPGGLFVRVEPGITGPPTQRRHSKDLFLPAREPAGWSVAGALRYRKIMQFQDGHEDLAVVGYHVVEIKQVITERSVPTSALVTPNIELRPSDVRRSGGYKHRIHRYCAVD